MKLDDICEKALSRMESQGLPLSTENLVFEEKTNKQYAEENLRHSLEGLSSTEQDARKSSFLERLRNLGTLGYCYPAIHENQTRFHIGIVREKPLADLRHLRDEESAVTSLVHELAHAWFDQHTQYGLKHTSVVVGYEGAKQEVSSIWNGYCNGIVTIFPPDLYDIRENEALRNMRRSSCLITPESYREANQAIEMYIHCWESAFQRKSTLECPIQADSIRKAYAIFTDVHAVKITEAYTGLLNALKAINDFNDEERLSEGWAYFVESVPLRKKRDFFADKAVGWFINQDPKTLGVSALKSVQIRGRELSEVLSEFSRTVGYSEAIQGYILFSIFPSLKEAKSAVMGLNSDTELLQAVLPYVDRRYRRK